MLPSTPHPNGPFTLFSRPPDEPVDAWLNRMWGEGWALVEGAFQPETLFRRRRGRIVEGKFQAGHYVHHPGMLPPDDEPIEDPLR